MPDNNGWSEYKQKVFFQLEELTKAVEKLDKAIDLLREDVIILKIKAWAFGIIGGAIISFAIQAFLFFQKK